MSRSGSNNFFHKGLVRDLSNYNTSNETYVDAINVEFATYNGNEFLIQTAQGNKYSAQLPNDYVPVAIKAYNGIAYILSSEVNDGFPSGRGEIGCFPSPSYTGINNKGDLQNNYKSLKNYQDNHNSPVRDTFGVVGDFNTDLLKFSTKDEFELEIQPSYDGSVNLIFTDNKNPARLVNSGFAKLGENKYEIVDRAGSKDTNLYNRASFTSTINLIQSSNQIPDLIFNGVKDGGKLTPGNYRFYFRYFTQDGNFTDLIEQSGVVGVFEGSYMYDIHGGLPSDTVSKYVSFTLDNIDTSFSYIRVYYSIDTSSKFEDSVSQFYEIDKRFLITKDRITINITGFENKLDYDADSLNVEFSQISTFKTMTQLQNRLFAANIKIKNFDNQELEDFAKSIVIDAAPTTMYLPGVTNASEITTESINQDNLRANSQSYNLAYYNPKNIYHRVGYWGGETYTFGIVFIMNDGRLSPVYPVVGGDDVNNSFSYNSNITYDDNDWNTNGQNINGTYRFPNRDNFVTLNGIVNINGVKFKIPDFTSIRNQTKGCFFVRAERNQDVITQGYLTPTLKSYTSFDQNFWDHDQSITYNDMDGTFPKKVTPFVAGYIEASNRRSNNNSINPQHFGFTISAQEKFYNNTTTSIVDNSRFAFYSTDFICDRETYGQILRDKDCKIVQIARAYARWEGGYLPSIDNVTGQSGIQLPSVFTTFLVDSQSVINQECNVSFVQGYTELVNRNKFSSAFNPEGYMMIKAEDSDAADNPRYNLYNRYTSYLGVNLTNSLDLTNLGLLLEKQSGLQPFVKYKGNLGQRLGTNLALVCNIYPSTQRTTAQVIDVEGQFGNKTFYPISKRFSWNKLTEAMIGDELTLFGGDCYINPTYRKIFSNAATTNVIELDSEIDNGKPKSLKVGQAMSIITESNYNSAMRTEDNFDVIETGTYQSERTYLPYVLRNGIGNYNQDILSVYRKNNFKTEESEGFNKGSIKVLGDKFNIPTDGFTQFIRSKFQNRILYSPSYSSTSFINEYRNLISNNSKDYNLQFGDIIKLVNHKDRLYCFQENGISLIPINERIQTGSGQAGAIFVESPEVLSPYPMIISDQYGIKYGRSVDNSGDFIYAIDVERKKIIRVEGNAIRLISDFSVNKLIEDTIEPIRNIGTDILDGAFSTYYDKHKKQVYFVIYG